MTIQKIIQESIAGNPLQMKEALAEELRNRVRLALEAKMDDSNGDDSSDEDNEDDDDEVKKEEFEQIDEISGATLGSYYVKAKKERDSEREKGQDVFKKAMADPKTDIHKMQADYNKHNDKAKKRNDGMSKAMDKLTGSGFARVHAKEEFQLEDFTVEELETFMESAEFEQLDELSKKTLSSYVTKASQNAADHAYHMGKQKADADDVSRFTNRLGMKNRDKVRDDLEKAVGADVDSQRAVRKTFNKRMKGIGVASSKLAK